MLSVLADDGRCGFEADADSAVLIDIDAFGGDPPDDILGCQYPRHRSLVQPCGMLPQTDIWRAARRVLKRYGDRVAGRSRARRVQCAAFAP